MSEVSERGGPGRRGRDADSNRDAGQDVVPEQEVRVWVWGGGGRGGGGGCINLSRGP